MTPSISSKVPLVHSVDELLFAFNEATLIDISDASGKILDVNERFCTLSGYRKEELIGQDHRILKSGVHSKRMFKHLWQTVLQGKIWRAEVCDKAKNGDLFWLDTTIVPLTDVNGKVYRFITVRSDITERVKAEQEKKHFESQLNALYVNTHDIIWRWNLKTDIIEFNHNLLLSLGYKSTKIKEGYRWFRRKIHPEDWLNFDALCNAAKPYEPGIAKSDMRFIDREGKFRYFMVRIAALNDDANNPLERVGSMLDVTALRTKEKEMMEAVINAQDDERRKIGMELHDNVVQMLGAASLYLNFFEANTGRELPAEMQMVKQLLQESMQDIRKLSHQLAPTFASEQPLFSAVQKLIESLRHNNKFKINLLYNISEEKVTSPEIITHIYRIMQEQLNNVLKHADATEVVIDLEGDSENIKILIADNGQGFNLQSTKGGIGLENIRRRVALAKGTMQLTSAPGNGCKLEVYIPLARKSPTDSEPVLMNGIV